MTTTGPTAGAEQDEQEPVERDDDWAWRARIRANRTSYRIYRAVVGVVGLAIVVAGIIAIPAPGPGWAIVFVGLAILASEFEKADRLLQFARRHVQRWTQWVGDQAWWVRVLLGLATLVLVLALFWTYFTLVGVPTWFPDPAEDVLHDVPGL
ncbi:TIGR02611 family protein [Angustibacter luteus]|uniref:TIGR02611 family protein n=1 Tax=Angustibacter luteus TaxID=658456 RepID=A0ABW1J937_9ACTN